MKIIDFILWFVFDLLIFVARVIFNMIVIIVRLLLKIFHVSLPFLEAWYQDSKLSKSERKAKKKVVQMLDEVYGEENNPVTMQESLRGAQVVEKTVKKVLDIPEIAAKLADDEDAKKIASQMELRCVVFDLAGQTLAFAIEDEDAFSQLSVGQRGTLVCKGNLFIEFIQ